VKSPSASRVSRVFFALWPDEPVREALGQLAQTLQAECGGRAMAAANIHATLAFIGNVPSERVPELETLAAAIDGMAFELSLDVISYWRHNRIVWIGTHVCPPALTSLAADFQDRLKANGWRVDERPYVPHITLLRDARRGPAAATPEAIAWPIAQFALVISRNDAGGTHYTPLGFWRLRSEDGRRGRAR
jgi:RNA 2',3'-cyclic 3'-phosphodiesterase